MLLWLPSLFGLLVCVLCRTRRAAPRAVGSGTRVGLLARKSSAGVGSGGRRRAALAACLPLLFGWWVPHPPAARGPGKPVGGRDGSRYVWFVVN